MGDWDVKKVNTVFLILFFLLITGCTESNEKLINGDKQMNKEMDDTISNYIIKKYSTSYSETEKQFEVHKVYGTKDLNGVITVYMWSYYAGFNKSTGIQEQSGQSLAAVIQLKKNEGTYSVIDYTETQDGSLFQSSLKKMFPKRYIRLVQNDSGNIDELQEEMDNKVKKWLEEKSV